MIGLSVVEQPPGCALQSQPADELERRLAHHAAKDAMKMERREARLRGERLELERLVEVRGDVLDDALHGLLGRRNAWWASRRPIYSRHIGGT